MQSATVPAALHFALPTFLALGARLGAAYLLTLPIGYERERDSQSAGLRTFPLVAVFGAGSDASSRLLQGLVTAVGFIGGGAIVKDQERVRGTATAAAIWAASAIGASAGLGQMELAVLVAVITFVTLRVLRRFEQRAGD